MIKTGAKVFLGLLIGGVIVFNVIDANAVSVETIEVEEKTAYTTEYIYDDTMRAGRAEIKQEGINGKKRVVYEVSKKQGKEITRKKQSEEVISQSQKEIVIKGTKPYYECSDGTDYDSLAEKNECENKIAWTRQRDKALQECNADANKINCWYDDYPGTTLHWETKPSYPSRGYSSGGNRIGAICRDGWRSNATGRGACSHHGGVSYWLYN